MRICGDVAVAELPATSVHVTESVPVAATVWVTVGVCGPEPESLHAHVTVTGPLLQPFWLTGDALTNWGTGLVVSMRMGPMASETALPALSRHWPLTSVPVVSVVRFALPVGNPDATPLSVSPQ